MEAPATLREKELGQRGFLYKEGMRSLHSRKLRGDLANGESRSSGLGDLSGDGLEGDGGNRGLRRESDAARGEKNGCQQGFEDRVRRGRGINSRKNRLNRLSSLSGLGGGGGERDGSDRGLGRDGGADGRKEKGGDERERRWENRFAPPFLKK